MSEAGSSSMIEGIWGPAIHELIEYLLTRAEGWSCPCLYRLAFLSIP